MTGAEIQMANLREKIDNKRKADFVEEALKFWHFEPIKFESNAGFSFRTKEGAPVYAKCFEDIFARRDNPYLAAAALRDKWVFFCSQICEENKIPTSRSNDPCVIFYKKMKEAFKAIIKGIQTDFYGDERGEK